MSGLEWGIAVLAQAGESTGPAAGAKDPFGGLMSMLPLFIFLYVVFYFLLIRPQRKQQREHENLLKALKKNDQVRTSGGMIGKVASIEDDKDQVVLKVDENQNVRVRVVRSAIVEVYGTEKSADTAAVTTRKTR